MRTNITAPDPVPAALQPVPAALQPVPAALQPVPTALQPVPTALQPVPRRAARRLGPKPSAAYRPGSAGCGATSGSCDASRASHSSTSTSYAALPISSVSSGRYVT